MQIIRLSFVLLFSSFILASCSAPSSFVTKKISEPSKPLRDYLVLYSVLHDDLQDMGEENYNTYLKGKFNNLEDKFFRDNLVDAYNYAAINAAESGKVWDYRNIFEDFKGYDFKEFEELLEKNGIEFVLLITEKRFLPREQLPDIINHQVYLFERGVESPIWVSYGYPGSLPGRLARGVHKDLKKERFF